MQIAYVEQHARNPQQVNRHRPQDGQHTPTGLALDALGRRAGPHRRINISRADIIAEAHARRLYDEATQLLNCLINERKQLPFADNRYPQERLDRAIAAARRRQRRRFDTWLWLSGQAAQEEPAYVRHAV